MSALLFNPFASSLWSSKSMNTTKLNPPSMKNARTRSKFVPLQAFFFNPNEQEPILKEALKVINEPILKEALKEPVAFMGGMFAGLLRLDLNDDPLKEWLQRTVEASGVTEEDFNGDESREPEDEVPQQIEIE